MMETIALIFLFFVSLAINPAKGVATHFVLRMAWNPSICMLEEYCSVTPVKAFTVEEMIAFDNNAADGVSEAELQTCYTTSTGTVPSDILDKMKCIWRSNTGMESTLWSQEYSQWGSCTGLSPTDYFKLAADKFSQYNPNDIMSNNKIAPPSVDRGYFLNILSSAWGARAWMICDIPSKTLIRVSVCMNPSPPHNPIDCPWGLTRASKYDTECSGNLTFPVSNAVSLPTTCSQFIPKTYETPIPSPPTAKPNPLPNNKPGQSPPTPSNPAPSPSSGSITGAIVGGLIGGLAVIGIAGVGIAVLLKRKKENEHSPTVPPLLSQYSLPTTMSPPSSQSYTTNNSYSSDQILLNYQNNGSSLPSLQVPLPLPQRSNSTLSDPLLEYIRSTVTTVSSDSASRGPLSSWQIGFEDINVEYPIGEGSWGRVYKATWHQTPVAVKILLDANGAQESNAAGVLNQSQWSVLMNANSPLLARLNAEASLMSNLHHPNIVQFLGLVSNPAALVTEYCERGSLTKVLSTGLTSAEYSQELTWPRRIRMAADCVRGMIYLHESMNPPILHRDLKSANLLVTSSWACKVTDFNLSKLMEESSRSTSMQAMNPRWLAPEVLQGQPSTMAADVFAFGVICWELLTWQLPWGTDNPWAIVGSVTAGNRLPIPQPQDLPGVESGNWPQLSKFIEMMQRCWAQEPAIRPSFAEVMRYLKEIEPSL